VVLRSALSDAADVRIYVRHRKFVENLAAVCGEQEEFTVSLLAVFLELTGESGQQLQSFASADVQRHCIMTGVKPIVE
jgi:hypothetical protein